MMQARNRRPLIHAMFVALAVLGTAACTTAPSRPRPVASAPLTPDEALAAYRGDIEERSAAERAVHSAEEAEAVRRHVDRMISPKVKSEFPLLMYINKAGSGPMAQHAYLFEYEGGELKYLDTWLVSTGREKQETSPKGARKFTTTPPGIFQFDVAHFSRLHKSNAWEADMPWAMFLRTRNNNPTTGIAMHAALDKYVHNLGQRASAGCIRLLPSNAEKLYKLLQTKYAGTVPRTVSSGMSVRITGGAQRGARALVIIEDANGRELMARYGASNQSADSGY